MGRADELRFEHDANAFGRRVLLAPGPNPFGAALQRVLESDRHVVRVARDVEMLRHGVDLFASRLGAPPYVIIVDICLAGGDPLAAIRHLTKVGGSTPIFLLAHDVDRPDLDELEHAGVVVFRAPISLLEVRYAVAHADVWKHMRPSRGFFDRYLRGGHLP
jgi:CheY-like chemotaxis protein